MRFDRDNLRMIRIEQQSRESLKLVIQKSCDDFGSHFKYSIDNYDDFCDHETQT